MVSEGIFTAVIWSCESHMLSLIKMVVSDNRESHRVAKSLSKNYKVYPLPTKYSLNGLSG